MPTSLVVMQPTSGCNMNCSYCYVPNRKVRDLMPFDVVESFFRVLSNSDLSNFCRIVWHAGEPLMAGISFYEKVFEIQKKYNYGNTEIEHCFQTNGILISDKWCRLFKKHNIKISISLDGPKEIHDATRVKWNGKGTYDEVMKAIRRLQEWDINYQVLAVVTESALDSPKEYFDFLLDNGIKSIGINIEELNTQTLTSSMIFKNQNERNLTDKYVYFMGNMFSNWRKHHNEIHIRELSQMYHVVNEKIKNPLFKRSSEEHEELGVLNIKKNGDISTFSPELIEGNNGNPDEFKIANITEISSFQDMAESQKLDFLKKQIESGIDQCRKNCEYFDFCGGGHLSAKYFENGTFNCSETNYCKLHRQKLVDVILEGLS
jgi:uncharacterized protein